MAYDILIEKKTGTDTEPVFVTRHLAAQGVNGEIAGISTLLRISGATLEQVVSLVREFETDGTVRVFFFESVDQCKDGQIVLSRRKGAICPMADVAYRVLMLKFPQISDSLRIKEYTVFTIESNMDGDTVLALRDGLIEMGRYRYVPDSELSAVNDKNDSAAERFSKRGKCSIAPRENPDLNEPFSTVGSRMVMNSYANRTYEDMKEIATLSARSGERTVYLDAEYSRLGEKLRDMDMVMDVDDANAAQVYFLSESREPTEMELRIISRCRSERWAHPALNTSINVLSYEDPNVEESVKHFKADCLQLGWSSEKATISDLIFAPLELFYEGNGAEGEERGTYPVRIDKEHNGISFSSDDGEKMLIFDLESNNSKTSVEPAGGATSCLGSVMRRALRMSAYPYEVMRLSGIASPYVNDGADTEAERNAAEQRMLARNSLDSFSEYARNVGIPCSANYEYISERFACKHMEVSAAVSVSDMSEQGREPSVGDAVLIFGSRTGRDGRVYRKHLKVVTEVAEDDINKNRDNANEEAAPAVSEEKFDTFEDKKADTSYIGGETLISMSDIAAKEMIALENGDELFGEAISGGNAFMQKKLMRICTDSEFRSAVKRIREVASSGLVAAVAAIARGAELYLDCVPVKYNGMSSTDVAFSDTCERMIAVVDKNEVANVIDKCASYGVICACIGVVTDDGLLSVYGGGKRIANLSTKFLLKSASERNRDAVIAAPDKLPESEPLKLALRPIEDATAFQRLFVKPTADHFAAYESIAQNQKLWAEARKRRVDSTVSETTGITHMSRAFAPTAISYIKDKNGVLTKDGEKLCSAVSIGMNPEICDADPYKGAYYAMTDAIARLVASGASYREAYTAIQIFHPTYKNDSEQTGDTVAAVTGAYQAQRSLEVPIVCGDFSFGGTNEETHKPSVAVFGIFIGKEKDFISSGFKAVGNRIAVFKPEMGKNGLPTPASQLEIFDRVERMFLEKKAYSAVSLTGVSLAEGIMHMCNGAEGELGFEFDADCTPEEMYGTLYGAIAVEVACNSDLPRGILYGTVTPSSEISAKHKALEKNGENTAEEIEHGEAENGHAVVDNGEIAISLDYLREIAGEKICSVYEKTPFPEIGSGSGFLAHIPSPPLKDTPKYPLSGVSIRRTDGGISVLVPRFNGSVGAESLIKALHSASNSKVDITAFDCDINSEMAEELAKKILRSGAVCFSDFAEHPTLLVSLLRHNSVANAIAKLRKAGGLIYGCGTAFNAFIQAGYIGGTENYGDIEGLTVAKNPLSGLTRTPTLIKANSCRSPFMLLAEEGQIYRTEISSYYGRLVGNPDRLAAASLEGIVPTVYAEDKNATDGYSRFDPCASALGIDSMTSADGTVFGQFSFPDRACYKAGREFDEYSALPIFRSIVKYLEE